MRELSEYLRRVAHHWRALVISAAGGVLGVVSAVTRWSPPPWIWVSLMLVGLVIAQFLAFRGLFRECRAQWPPPGKGLRRWKAGHNWPGQGHPTVFLWLYPPSGASDDDTIRCEVTWAGGGAVCQDNPVRPRTTGEYGAWFPSDFPAASPVMMDGPYTVVWTTRRNVPGLIMLRKHQFHVRHGEPEGGKTPPGTD
jgi:hypothetical protein